MRIGFDMLAVQSPDSRNRGIGRYVHQLTSSVQANHAEHDYFLYAHEKLPADRIPHGRNVNLRDIRVDSSRGESSIAQAMERLVQANRDELDLFVVSSPFEHWTGYQAPAKPTNGLKLAAVMYDTIPFRFFANDPGINNVLGRLYRGLDNLRRYDLLLAISEATRQDCLSLLGLPDDRVVTISTASDGKFFVPHKAPLSETDQKTLRALGIQRPFVLNVGGMCPRKNNESLIDAFAMLPAPLQHAHQLVLSFAVNDHYRKHLQKRAKSLGVGDALIVTNYVSDETLRLLYQRCAAFAYPSQVEGFGLPILEAMHCGAAVIAGNNSSQIEVVGKAGLLINVNDPADLADKLVQILENPEFAQSLQQRALVQARTFGWDRTAGLAVAAVEGLGQRQPVRRSLVRHRVAQRRIAFFSPFPPKYSGISDYSARLLQELKHTYEIDLYHEPGYVPQPALQSTEFMCCDGRFFPRYAAAKGYQAVLYQMGNSGYHDFMYDTMQRHPGIVTLHDFHLAGYQLYRGAKLGREREYLREEMLLWYPERTEEILAFLGTFPWHHENVIAECARRGMFLNRRIVKAAKRLVVHSQWCLEKARATSSEDAERVVMIPQGAVTRELSPEQRGQIRARFGLSPNGLVVAAFGFLSAEKMICEALDAFQAVASGDESAVFVIAGKEVDSGDARRHAAELGLTQRVRFLGRQIDKDFVDLVAATDVGVNLRRPPTNGETSAALLNLLGSGVATMVTDVATFSDYPDATVCKVRWESEGPAGLKRAMLELASDRKKRETIGHAAREHVRNRHDWSKVAELYVEVIENCHAVQAGTSSRGRNGSGPMPRMHAIAQEVGT